MLLFYLPVTEIYKASLVCKMWNEEAKRFMRNARCFKIVDDKYEAIDEFLNGRVKGIQYMATLEIINSTTQIETFDILMCYRGRGLHKLILDRCTVKVHSFTCLLAAGAFPNLAILSLCQIKYTGTDGLRGVSDTVFLPDDDNDAQLSNLRYLKIEERGSTTKTTLKNVSVICPNLRTLIFGNCPVPILSEYVPSVKLELLENLQFSSMDGRKMSIEFFHAFTRLNMRSLKSLTLYGMDPTGAERMKSLKKFLISVGPTLESLHLGQRMMISPEYHNRGPSAFPVPMPNLKKMSLSPGFCRSLRLLDRTPSLVSFSCVRTKPEDWSKVVKKGIPKQHEGLKNLDLGDISPIPLGKIASCFPNLVKLELNLSKLDNHDEAFRSIFKSFPNLTLLCVYNLRNKNLLTDSGITGIDANTMTNSWMQKVQNAAEHRKHPYAGNMLSELLISVF
jgi:hypothetical protein